MSMASLILSPTSVKHEQEAEGIMTGDLGRAVWGSVDLRSQTKPASTPNYNAQVHFVKTECPWTVSLVCF